MKLYEYMTDFNYKAVSINEAEPIDRMNISIKTANIDMKQTDMTLKGYVKDNNIYRFIK